MKYYITKDKELAEYLKVIGFTLEDITGFYNRTYKFKYRSDMIKYINIYESRKYWD